tara:strand:- start:22 stop:294 length:273 start_codon:yes stop_codon:yes gene_type:complete
MQVMMEDLVLRLVLILDPVVVVLAEQVVRLIPLIMMEVLDSLILTYMDLQTPNFMPVAAVVELMLTPPVLWEEVVSVEEIPHLLVLELMQ